VRGFSASTESIFANTTSNADSTREQVTGNTRIPRILAYDATNLGSVVTKMRETPVSLGQTRVPEHPKKIRELKLKNAAKKKASQRWGWRVRSKNRCFILCPSSNCQRHWQPYFFCFIGYFLLFLTCLKWIE